MIMLHIKLNGITKSSNMVPNICSRRTPTLTLESNGHYTAFSEPCNVAYQIKGNHECSNMVANILHADPFTDPWDGVNRSKVLLFQNMVMLHIKVKGIKTFSCKPPPQPPDAGLGSKFHFIRTWTCCISK